MIPPLPFRGGRFEWPIEKVGGTWTARRIELADDGSVVEDACIARCSSKKAATDTARRDRATLAARL